MNITNEHQDRVLAEKAELSERLNKLGAFMRGPIYVLVHPPEQARLCRQHLIMKLYEQVLSERIAAF